MAEAKRQTKRGTKLPYGGFDARLPHPSVGAGPIENGVPIVETRGRKKLGDGEQQRRLHVIDNAARAYIAGIYVSYSAAADAFVEGFAGRKIDDARSYESKKNYLAKLIGNRVQYLRS